MHMKKIAMLTVLLMGLFSTFAQTETPKSTEPKTCTSTDPIATTVDKEPEFPGGVVAWQRFLVKNLRYPQAAIDNKIKGEVVLKFVVCTDGTTGDIEVVSGPEALRQSAFDVVKKASTWTPALQNGQPVKAIKTLPLVYRLEL
jgi:periplasmic protein TonB